MDNWRKNRWTIYYLLTWAFVLGKTFSVAVIWTKSTNLYPFVRPLVWPLRILALLIILFISEVVRYFKESPYILSSVYIFAITNVLITLFGVELPFMTQVIVSLPTYLYYVICLFFIKAGEVSKNFRRLAILDIALMLVTYLYKLLVVEHWPSEAVNTLYTALYLLTYIVILLILHILKRFPSEHITSIEKDIASIGEPIVEQ